MNKGLELNCLYLPEGSSELEKLGIETKAEDAQIMPATFWNIDAVAKYTEDGVNYSDICSGGHNYICVLPYEELIRVINNWKRNG